jgi:hypothetical protein
MMNWVRLRKCRGPIAAWIHCVYDRSLSFLLPLRRKMSSGHSSRSFSGGIKIRKVQAEHLGLDTGFDAHLRQLMSARR